MVCWQEVQSNLEVGTRIRVDVDLYSGRLIASEYGR